MSMNLILQKHSATNIPQEDIIQSSSKAKFPNLCTAYDHSIELNSAIL